ncbi:hypothetical protein IDM40_25460 [Nocardiopsis sp. HNM0947]|uniref:Secreted protein n=1 Tax=Nocardiopsis coralli TaxID=2772213 RepID=A0ABR9PDY0_9ACTN|nr:hypothetical protein [Nocardiopsis coralli]MBE3002019.1 hypothetical protein [Nocardiopsis coralli]
MASWSVLACLAALAVATATGQIRAWTAAELLACGSVLAVAVYLALLLRRLEAELSEAEFCAEEQAQECAEVVEESREELVVRTDDLRERSARAAQLLARRRARMAERPEPSERPAEPPRVTVSSAGTHVDPVH